MFEWDQRKAALNLAKHDVSFDAVWRFDWNTAVEFEDDRFHYDELRAVAIGWIDGSLHTLTYTWRGDKIRVISLRPSDKPEHGTYAKARPKPDDVTQEEWDSVDSPPLTKRMLEGMRPCRETMPPEIFARLTKGRGPQKAPTKEQVSLRLDRDVLNHFRSTGHGWQTRMNEALRQVMKPKAKAG